MPRSNAPKRTAPPHAPDSPKRPSCRARFRHCCLWFFLTLVRCIAAPRGDPPASHLASQPAPELGRVPSPVEHERCGCGDVASLKGLRCPQRVGAVMKLLGANQSQLRTFSELAHRCAGSLADLCSPMLMDVGSLPVPLHTGS